jgi:hypothetical protein
MRLPIDVMEPVIQSDFVVVNDLGPAAAFPRKTAERIIQALEAEGYSLNRVDCHHGFTKQTGGHYNDCPVCYQEEYNASPH